MKPCKLILAFLSSIILFAACKKDSNNNKAKTKTDLITQAAWKFSAASAAGYGDVSSYIPACYKDNTYTFVSDGSGSVDESANVCAPSSAGPFTWNFTAGEDTLHISTPLFQGGSSDFKMVSLSETSLVVSQSMTIAPLPATTVEVTFVHP